MNTRHPFFHHVFRGLHCLLRNFKSKWWWSHSTQLRLSQQSIFILALRPAAIHTLGLRVFSAASTIWSRWSPPFNCGLTLFFSTGPLSMSSLWKALLLPCVWSVLDLCSDSLSVKRRKIKIKKQADAAEKEQYFPWQSCKPAKFYKFYNTYTSTQSRYIQRIALYSKAWVGHACTWRMQILQSSNMSGTRSNSFHCPCLKK